MKNAFFLVLLVFMGCSSEIQEPLKLNVIPHPNEITFGKGVFKPENKLTLSLNDKMLEPVAGVFATQMKKNFEVHITESSNADIQLEILQPLKKSESYKLESNRKETIIRANSANGIFNGLQTLRQMLLFSKKNNGRSVIPVVTIKDNPRFGWRGVMLDESRHFFGVKKVKELLDLMALHKLNIFHWHLTDVPGWRIEIKKFPKLTELGGIGNQSDAEAPARFYTQDEIKAIANYASERFIEVIPEIDMPGHATAANRAYPEFSGGGSEKYPEFTFNPGKNETYGYLTDILREVAVLFPSEYIHLGGDEVHFGNESWNTNRDVRKLIKQHHLSNLKEVERYFVNRMADSIHMLGKTVVGWDEIVDHGLSPNNSLVMWWRHNMPEKLNEALNRDFSVVLCPRIPLYFDFVQHESHEVGRRWAGAFSPLDLVYEFPPDTLPGFQKHYQQVAGIQANVWTERISYNHRLDFMFHPRLSALAEAAWTNKEVKTFNRFKERLETILQYLNTQDIHYFNPFEPESSPEPEETF